MATIKPVQPLTRSGMESAISNVLVKRAFDGVSYITAEEVQAYLRTSLKRPVDLSLVREFMDRDSLLVHPGSKPGTYVAVA